MRKYQDKQNVQKKAYYTDRYNIQPTLAKSAVEDDAIFAEDLRLIKEDVEVLDAYIQADQMVVWIKPKDNLKTLQILKTNGYENLTEMSAVDFLAQRNEFEVFYQMLSMQKHKRLRVKCCVKPKETVQSVNDAYRSADWAERECYDMFGIIFTGHPYFKRILLPDDWSGHPLLKTYPLLGDEDAQWYEIDKIFGKEYRDVVGPEQRDSARVDVKDTVNFAHLGHEVLYNQTAEGTKFDGEYQEENGVTIVSKLKKDQSKMLKERP